MPLTIEPYAGPLQTISDYQRLSVGRLEELAREGDELAQQVLAPLEARGRASIEAGVKRLGIQGVVLEEVLGAPSRSAHTGSPSLAVDLIGAKQGHMWILDQLAERWFPRSRVFYGDRWRQLEPRFRECISFGESPAQAWRRMVRWALLLTLNDPEWKLVPENELYPWLRRRVRSELERALLAGTTTDANQEQSLTADLVGNDLEAEYLAQVQRDPQWGIVSQVATELTPEQLRILMARQGQDVALAEELGIKRATLRKRRQRLIQDLKVKVQKLMGGALSPE